MTRSWGMFVAGPSYGAHAGRYGVLWRAVVTTACALVVPVATPVTMRAQDSTAQVSAARAGVGSLTGFVHDSLGRPVAGANIDVLGTRFSAVSDSAGRFVLNAMPGGAYTLRIQRLGRRALRVPNVRVRTGETSDIDVAMSSAPVQLHSVVVSASRQAESVTDAPAVVTRVEPNEITSNYGNSFVAALREVQGVDFSQLGITSAAFNARGFNSSANNRLLVLEDGRVDVLPASGLPFGNLTSIPSIDLAGVEVMLGPSSALYGANATNGVITLQTKDPRQYQGTMLELVGGNHAYRDVQLRHAGVSTNGRVGYKLSAEYMSVSDFQNQLRYAGNVDESGIGGHVDWDATVARGEGGLTYYRGAERYEFNTGMSQSDGVTQTPAGRDQLVNWQNRHAQVKWNAPGWYASLYATQASSGGTFSLSRFSGARETTPATISDDSIAHLSDFPSVGRVYVAEGEHSFDAPRWKTRFLVGGQLRRDDISSRREWLTDRLTNKNVVLYQGGLYAQSETPLSATLRLSLAARADRGSSYDASFSPKAALLYSPRNDQTFRLTYARAFRAPTIGNLYSSIPDYVKLRPGLGGVGIYGNREGFTVQDGSGASLARYAALVPEKSHSFEIGYKGIFGDKVSVDAALYRSHYEHFISPLVAINSHLMGSFAYDVAGNRIASLNGPQSVLTYINLGSAGATGGDFSARYIATEHLSAGATVSFTDLTRVNRTSQDTSASAEATSLNTSPVRWNARVDFSNAKTNTRLGLLVRHATGFTFRSGVNAGIVPTYESLDANASMRLPSIGAQLNISVLNIVSCRAGSYELRLTQTSPGTLVQRHKCDIGLRHIEMINMPEIGTMIFVGLRYQR